MQWGSLSIDEPHFKEFLVLPPYCYFVVSSGRFFFAQFIHARLQTPDQKNISFLGILTFEKYLKSFFVKQWYGYILVSN